MQQPACFVLTGCAARDALCHRLVELARKGQHTMQLKGIFPPGVFSASVSPVLVLCAMACGAAAGTGPHEMSAAQHQQAAATQTAEATAHAEQYDPAAGKQALRCAPGQTKTGVCWRETLNPSKGHQDMAKEHRKVAEQHRAASAALVAAEEWACAGLGEEDRDMSPFAHAGDVQSVSRFREEVVTQGGLSPGGYIGATIVFKAVPGLTGPWLQRIIDCHLARNAVIGHPTASSEMTYCPLTLKGVQAVVREVGSGFAVDVTSHEAGAANEIWARVQRLGASGG
jgi:hypothetical protein